MAPGANGLIVISGCSGGGKSTLLAELARRGFATVPEPGRRVVAEEMAAGGSALPWIDLAAFARRALAIALQDRCEALAGRRPVFFDRSAIDVAAALEHVTGEPALASLRQAQRYDACVFMVPPWPDIYATDAARQHGWTEALAEHERLQVVYPSLGYEVTQVPKLPVAARADWLLGRIGSRLRASG